MFNVSIRGAGIASLAALGLLTAGCDSKAQKEIKEQAKAIDKSYDAQADLMEARAASAPNEAVVDARADVVRAQGEQIKDHLDNLADGMETKP